MMLSADIQELLQYATPEELAEIDALLAETTDIWEPLPGPQMMAYNSEADIIGYGGAAGGGKLLRLSEPVATPSGFTPMGSLRVGDTVLDKDGRPCRVTAISAVEPQPELWAFTFDDGTEVTSCVDHQWLTFDAKELAALTRRDPAWREARRARRPSRAKGNKSEAFVAAMAKRNAEYSQAGPLPTGSTRTTRQIIDTLRLPSGRANHAVPVAAPLVLPDADLPVDPYVLGAWLGDGTSASGGFTNVDPEITQEIKRAGYEVTHNDDGKTHYIRGLKTHLRGLGLIGDKHIPDLYLRASAAQRLALLQGLMDTDGTVAKHSGSAEFCNTNEKIIDGAVQLIASLGWKVRKREGRAKINGKDCGPKWTLKFVPGDYVFRLPRKRDIQKIATRRTTAFRYILDARPAPSEPGRCITVDSPSRTYLVGNNLIPTHNTDLLAGLVLTKHKRALIVRREKAQTEGVIQRLEEIVGNKDGFNSQKAIWKLGDDKLVEFAGLDNPGDERRWQGRPHDLKAFDEATEQREQQVRFVMGWNRTNDRSIKPRVVLTFNPPTTAEGRWVIKFFAPWLQKGHPNPAAPGELRWFTTKGEDQDYEVPDGRPFVFGEEGELIYDYDPKTPAEKIVRPKSRTFIPARLTDNPYYMATGYMSTLQSLPEPLRSQMLNGDFGAGVKEDEWQAIPTAWIEAAQKRWKPKDVLPPMDSVGVDVSRGGDDKTEIATRHGWWFDELTEVEGQNTVSGRLVAGQIISVLRDKAPIHIDVIGVGASPYDALSELNIQTIGVDMRHGTNATDKSGHFRFLNTRAWLVWRFRELLDPAANNGIALPPCPKLAEELAAYKWELSGGKVKIIETEKIKENIGRSPDRATAVLLASMETPKRDEFEVRKVEHLDPLSAFDHQRAQSMERMADYNPLAGM